MSWGPGELSPQHPDGDGQNAASMLEAGEAPGVVGAAWVRLNGGSLTPPGNAKLGKLEWRMLSLPFALQSCKPPSWLRGRVMVSFSLVMCLVQKLQPRGDARLGAMPGAGHHGWDPPAAPAAEISQRISASLPHPQQI